MRTAARCWSSVICSGHQVTIESLTCHIVNIIRNVIQINIHSPLAQPGIFSYRNAIHHNVNIITYLLA